MFEFEKQHPLMGSKTIDEMGAYAKVGLKNKSIDVASSMYGSTTSNPEDKESSSESKAMNLGIDKMFTGNTYFDIGLSIGRRIKEKRDNKA